MSVDAWLGWVQSRATAAGSSWIRGRYPRPTLTMCTQPLRLLVWCCSSPRRSGLQLQGWKCHGRVHRIRGRQRITYKKNTTKPTSPRQPHAPSLFLHTYFFARQALLLFSKAGNLPVSWSALDREGRLLRTAIKQRPQNVGCGPNEVSLSESEVSPSSRARSVTVEKSFSSRGLLAREMSKSDVR
jgi:hypothetical protein